MRRLWILTAITVAQGGGLFDNVPCNLNCEPGIDCCNTGNEEQSSSVSNTESYYCDDDTEIKISLGAIIRCDGNDDCADSSDEQGCLTCSSEQFSCDVYGTAACIPNIKKCDGSDDCDNGDDELDCPTSCNKPAEFNCGSCCVPAAEVCTDGSTVCTCENDDSSYYGDSDYYSDAYPIDEDVICGTWDLKQYQIDNSSLLCWSYLYIFAIVLHMLI